MSAYYIKRQDTGAGMGVYMDYILRYATYPATISQLKKLATTKQFHRLVDYFNELPQDSVYGSSKEVLEQLKQVRQR